MKSKNKMSRYTKVTAAVWVVCVIVLGAGYGMFYVPQKMEIDRLQGQCEESRTTLERAQKAALAETRQQMKLRCEEVCDQINRFSTEYDAETELVFQIGQLASELSLDKFSSKQQDIQGYPTVDKSKVLNEAWLNINFFATFNQFAQFINELERNCPVVFIEDICFRRGTRGTNSHDVSLQLSFLTEQQTGKHVAMATD